MSVALVLVLLALGALMACAVSQSQEVTLRWLRLADLIALSLLAGAVVFMVAVRRGWEPMDVLAAGAYPLVTAWTLALMTSILGAGTIVHLILVQLGRRSGQRMAVAMTVIAAGAALMLGPVLGGTDAVGIENDLPRQAGGYVAGLSLILSAWLMGGSLMTMLLGHAYLTAGGEMTQRPFARLTVLLGAGLVVRLILTGGFGLWPWWAAWSAGAYETSQVGNALFISARFLVGLAVPLVMTWMAWQCVRIRSNQSATGILYVATTLILIGELLALSLTAGTGLAF